MNYDYKKFLEGFKYEIQTSSICDTLNSKAFIESVNEVFPFIETSIYGFKLNLILGSDFYSDVSTRLFVDMFNMNSLMGAMKHVVDKYGDIVLLEHYMQEYYSLLQYDILKYPSLREASSELMVFHFVEFPGFIMPIKGKKLVAHMDAYLKNKESECLYKYLVYCNVYGNMKTYFNIIQNGKFKEELYTTFDRYNSSMRPSKRLDLPLLE